jgi:hypothetical protein
MGRFSDPSFWALICGCFLCRLLFVLLVLSCGHSRLLRGARAGAPDSKGAPLSGMDAGTHGLIRRGWRAGRTVGVGELVPRF